MCLCTLHQTDPFPIEDHMHTIGSPEIRLVLLQVILLLPKLRIYTSILQT